MFFYPTTIFVLLNILSVSANLLLQLEPGTKRTIYFTLDQESSDIQLKLFKIEPDSNIKYTFTRDEPHYTEESSYEDSEDTQTPLKNEFNKKITEQGVYKLVISNEGGDKASVNLYSHTNKKMGNEESDVKAIRNLFSNIENKLLSLYNTNMRLKSMQDKNILEARRIIKGLYVMIVIPILYFVVGFVKVRATMMMFSPNKGIKP